MTTTVTLADKYEARDGHAYMSGTQALVRLTLIQQERDAAAGLKTAGFVTGYRGSPLGTVDQEFWKASSLLDDHNVRFHPGVNEDLAATTVWGTQQVNLFEGARYDGVFAMWYGKGPGVDRSGDVFRHANYAGTAPLGGVLAVAGDDHACKSSTLPHQTEQVFEAVGIPVLAPSNVQEVLDFGLYGWALSRFSGCWVALKCVSDVIESSASVDVSPDRVQIVYPDDDLARRSIRYPDPFLAQEQRLLEHKHKAVLAFARANRLDRVVLEATKPKLGIITTGKSYLDVREALDLLGMSEDDAASAGIAIYKVGMVWPLEPEGIASFARSVRHLVVIEEKRALIETQVKTQLFNIAETARPVVSGKTDGRTGAELLSAAGELNPAKIARALASLIKEVSPGWDFSNALSRFDRVGAQLDSTGNQIARPPHYCSGCPHNTSTKVPDGSRATAGIGCHGMATFIYPQTKMFCQMGGEGMHWVGQQMFSDTPHVFSNMGEGTYFHSGYLAIRAAVAAGTPMTYKILFNDAVAMTGGQPVDGVITVPRITHQLAAEGVEKIVVVTDEPEKYGETAKLASGVPVRHRDDLDAIQRELRDYRGVSAIVYDQTCAAEKRRRRKRGTLPDPQRRVLINDRVCEACGDCSEQSNCISVVPKPTALGIKRAIDQSSCNKDFSCLKGFCPSFVTIEGGKLRKGKARSNEDLFAIPDPELPGLAATHSVLVTGIGGTGVVTIGALLGMAAHIEGKSVSVMDMAGLAQKGGSVWSHIRIAPGGTELNAAKIATGQTATLIGCDLVVAASDETISRLDPRTTRAIVNTGTSITGDEVRTLAARAKSGDVIGNVGPDLSAARLKRRLSASLDPTNLHFVNGSQIAATLMGDAIATNLFLLGYAWQKGLIPLAKTSIADAIQLNGTAVKSNLASFEWGRRAAHDLARVLAAIDKPEAEAADPPTLDEGIEQNWRFLKEYQNAAYAERYLSTVRMAQQSEGSTPEIVEAVASNLFKLMAYKDEYEVARLYTDGRFLKEVSAQFEGDYKLRFNLAPPILARKDPLTGIARKREFGSWMLLAFKILTRMRRLRGSWLDPFRGLKDRKLERALITEYETTVRELLLNLSSRKIPIVLEILRLPDAIRGYGHVKERHLAQVAARRAELVSSLEKTPGAIAA